MVKQKPNLKRSALDVTEKRIVFSKVFFNLLAGCFCGIMMMSCSEEIGQR